MNAQKLYLASLTAFGVVSIVDTILAVLAGPTTIDWITGFVGVVVLVAAVAGFSNPEESGAPTESGPLLWVVVVGASLFVLTTVATWL
jgi:apolipoprotein N-acyltransferase